MSIFKKNLPKKSKLKIALLIFLIILLTVGIILDVLLNGPLTSFLTNREEIIKRVNEAGIFAPLIYIFLQILQTVLAPIPGGVVSPIGGFLFGWWGVLWTSIGATIGAGIVFYVSKRFGRSLVEKIIKKEALEKFDFVFGDRAGIIIFLLFLIPGLPDDTICYIGGLTKVPIKTLLISFFVGRLPAVIGNNYIGMGLGEGNLALVLLTSILGILIIGFVYWKQDLILKLVGKTPKTPPETPPKA